MRVMPVDTHEVASLRDLSGRNHQHAAHINGSSISACTLVTGEHVHKLLSNPFHRARQDVKLVLLRDATLSCRITMVVDTW